MKKQTKFSLKENISTGIYFAKVFAEEIYYCKKLIAEHE